MFRRVVDEIVDSPDIFAVLDCGHRVESRIRKRDAMQVARRWCSECWRSSRPVPAESDVLVRLTAGQAHWLKSVLHAGIAGESYHRDDVARAVISAVERAKTEDQPAGPASDAVRGRP